MIYLLVNVSFFSIIVMVKFYIKDCYFDEIDSFNYFWFEVKDNVSIIDYL